MNPLHDDQRISGYLDGELSADELARFEERLAESAELRQLVEELRALRGTLDLLPRHRLGDDFADRVLRRAEREMLAAGESQAKGESPASAGDAAAQSVAASQPSPAIDPHGGPLDGSRGWKRRAVRPAIYAALAIAAAVLIMVLNPDQKKNQEVAQVGNEAKQSAAPASGSVVQAIDSSVSSSPVHDREAEATNHLAELGKKSGNAPVVEKPRAETIAKDQQDDASSAKRSLAPAGPAGEIAQGQADKALAPQPYADQVAGGRDAPVAANPLPENKPASAPVVPAQVGSAGGEVAGRRSSQSPALKIVATRDGSRANVTMAGGMVVAECIAAPEVAEKSFNRLLARHGIAWSQPTDDVPAPAANLEKYKQDNDDKGAASKARDQLAPRLDRQDLADKQSGGETAPEKDVEIVYVEGTPEQIHALVSDLKAEPDVYRSLTVAAAPSGSLATFGYRGVAPAASEAGRAELPVDASGGDKLSAFARPAGQQPGNDAEPRQFKSDMKSVKASEENRKQPEPATPLAADKSEQNEPQHEVKPSAAADKSPPVLSQPEKPAAIKEQFDAGKGGQAADAPAPSARMPNDRVPSDRGPADVRRAAPPAEMKTAPRGAPAALPPPAAPAAAAKAPASQNAASKGVATKEAAGNDAIADGKVGDKALPVEGAGGIAVGGAPHADRSAPAGNKPAGFGGGKSAQALDAAKAKNESPPAGGFAMRLKTLPPAAESAAQEQQSRDKDRDLRHAADAPAESRDFQKDAEGRGRVAADSKQNPPAANGAASPAASPTAASPPAVPAPQSNGNRDGAAPAAPAFAPRAAIDAVSAPPARMQAIFVFRRPAPAVAGPASPPAAQPASPPRANDKK